MIHKMKFVWVCAILFSTAGCATVKGWFGMGGEPAPVPADVALVDTAKRQEEQKAREQAQKALDELKAQNDKSRKQIARLQFELQAMHERLSTVRRQVQVLSRGNRSGVFYEDPSLDKEEKALGFEEDEEDEDDDHSAPAVVDMKKSTPRGDQKQTLGREGFSEESGDDDEIAQSEISQPAQLVADAELKMRRGQYGEAVVSLKEVEKRFPEYKDGGQSSLLLAEAWLKLGSYENVFPVLRSFYLKHPNSNETLKAKLVEAQSLEGSGQKERAAGIYREIVSNGPQTAQAERARASLQRLRDAR